MIEGGLDPLAELSNWSMMLEPGRVESVSPLRIGSLTFTHRAVCAATITNTVSAWLLNGLCRGLSNGAD
jgi:hypothetical protein